jgi:hypothetical protein
MRGTTMRDHGTTGRYVPHVDHVLWRVTPNKRASRSPHRAVQAQHETCAGPLSRVRVRPQHKKQSSGVQHVAVTLGLPERH